VGSNPTPATRKRGIISLEADFIFMEAKYKQFVSKYIKKSDRVVLGVSGGPDSMALLTLAEKYLPGQFVVAHVNHGLRAESQKEEKYLQAYCSERKLPFYVKRLKPKSSSEAYLREARYDYFNKVMSSEKASYIMLAHNLDDQAETVLLNLTRGSGPFEIWGMREREGSILRPLLDVRKIEILQFNKKHKVHYFTDKSNLQNDYSRNLIRNKVVPVLLTLNPKSLEAIGRSGRLGNEANDWLQAETQAALKKVANNNTIDLTKFQKLPAFLQKEVLREMFFDMTGKRSDVYGKNISEVLRLIRTTGNKKTTFGRFTIEKNYDKISFNPKVKKRQESLPLRVGESQNFNGFTINATLSDGKAVKNNILLSPDYAYNLSVRTWQRGDKIKTKGGTKKLQDIFTDAKVEAALRKSWPILVKGNEILWVPLLAASTKALPGQQKNVLIIEVHNETKKI
jgi:tRNA(Ile)-lysidine synthase